MNPISDLAEFQFPAAPPSRAQSEKPATPRERKLSEAVCMLSESERKDRIERLEKADDFVTLSDGRCFRVGVMVEGKLTNQFIPYNYTLKNESNHSKI